MNIIFTLGISKLATETLNTFKYSILNILFRTGSEIKHWRLEFYLFFIAFKTMFKTIIFSLVGKGNVLGDV